MIWFLGISVPVHRFKTNGVYNAIESYPLVFPFISKSNFSADSEFAGKYTTLLFAIFSHECSVLLPGCSEPKMPCD